MKITLDKDPRYTSEEDIKTLKGNAPDHEVWFRLDTDGNSPEFFYLRASPRIGLADMQELIARLTA